MLIDTPPSPPPPPAVAAAAATSLRRMEKSISSIVNATLLVDDNQVSNQHNILGSSTGRGKGRDRGEPKKLVRKDIDLNYSDNMLIDNPPSPPPPPSVVIATSSRIKEESNCSIVNTTPLVVGD
ncbi:hypothetical protein RDI58_000869 [Solanum bulbocastanum]|uniref:Uncharacterized protein n=1 Tax=Solanum bulbocastanum TaxID=147425 RepID=A0AAN8YPG0_SOLBU